MSDIPEPGTTPAPSDNRPEHPPVRVRSVRIHTVVLGLLLFLLSVGALMGELTSVRFDMTVVAIVVLAVAGAGLFAAGLTSVLRRPGAGGGD
jgi:hypothetical protein